MAQLLMAQQLASLLGRPLCFPPCHAGVKKLVEGMDSVLCRSDSRCSSKSSSSSRSRQGDSPMSARSIAAHEAIMRGYQDRYSDSEEDTPDPWATALVPRELFHEELDSDQDDGVLTPPVINSLEVSLSELAMLEAQAQKLHATVARRRRVEGANCSGDNVSSIIAHYECILDEVQLRILELSLLVDGASASKAA